MCCVSLGYNKTSCKTPGLKCPFGEYYYCPKDCEDGYEWKDGACQPEEPKAAVLGQCTGYAKNCKIGDILNSDGTCSADIVSGKKPLAVVVYIGSDNCGQAITANSIGSYEWKSDDSYISVDLPGYDNYTSAIKDYDSCGNTQKITQEGSSYEYPAAWAAKNYSPSAASKTKGKWCLPAAGVWNSVYTNMAVIDNTISKLGGSKKFSESPNSWSSTIGYKGTSEVWFFMSIDGGTVQGGLSNDPADFSRYVYPVIEF